MMPNTPAAQNLAQATAQLLQRLAKLQGEAAEKLNQLVQRLLQQQSEGHAYLALTVEEQAWCQNHLPQGNFPLVCDGNALYTQRTYAYENRLAQDLMRLAQQPKQSFNSQVLEKFFPEKNEQSLAAQGALTHDLAIISGGPGTGKTTTVVKILALLLEEDPHLDIALAAPTGKAAMRLQQSIALGLADLRRTHAQDGTLIQVLSRIPQEVKTLHRLLGWQAEGTGFRHKSSNPLGADVVVIDEASMVDLPLMSKTLDALKWGARLILLGDQYQLSSVEMGAVLADICQGLPQNTFVLNKSYRSQAQISALAGLIKAEEAIQAWQQLEAQSQSHSTELQVISPQGDWFTQAKHAYQNYHHRVEQVIQPLLQGGDFAEGEVLQNANFDAISQAFDAFQILCATREGPQGVNPINARLVHHFDQGKGLWYWGRPVMILQNDPALQLYNGDVGFYLPNAQGVGQVFFQRHTAAQPGHGGSSQWQGFSPSRLPQHETAYAMTIHKSQGSEFSQVMILLPEEDSPILSTSLIYTALTRAKYKAIFVTSPSLFTSALRTQQRRSRLSEKIQGLR